MPTETEKKILTFLSLYPTEEQYLFKNKILNIEEISLFSVNPSTNLNLNFSSEILTYIIFTSGSTGQPKGVKVTQQNFLSSFFARKEYYKGDKKPQNLILFGSITFDINIAVIFWALLTGIELVILPEENNTDLEQLANKINEHKISHLICTAIIYKQLLINYAKQTGHKFTSLHSIILGGETFYDELITEHKKMLPNAFLFNEYGLTETTVWTTVQTIYNPKKI